MFLGDSGIDYEAIIDMYAASDVPMVFPNVRVPKTLATLVDFMWEFTKMVFKTLIVDFVVSVE